MADHEVVEEEASTSSSSSSSEGDDVWRYLGDGDFAYRDDWQWWNRRFPHHSGDGGDGLDNVFIYMGGEAPHHVTRVRIDKSVDVIEDGAFYRCEHLVHVETHDGIRRVGSYAFCRCKLLRGINLRSAAEIGAKAFYYCENLESAEFGKELQTIGWSAFHGCSSLKYLKLPSIITIETAAFAKCSRLIDVELSDRLDKIESGAFSDCARLERIAIPLKRNLFEYKDFERYDKFDHYELKRDMFPSDCSWQKYDQFDHCEQLRKVDLVRGAHTTVASLHMESWRTEMIARINRINGVLPTNSAKSLKLSDIRADDKSEVMHQWMGSVMRKLCHFKAEHYRYVKEAITLLELALWKARLEETEENDAEGRAENTKTDDECSRRERRITCGADIVIKNVLPFLQLS